MLLRYTKHIALCKAQQPMESPAAAQPRAVHKHKAAGTQTALMLHCVWMRNCLQSSNQVGSCCALPSCGCTAASEATWQAAARTAGSSAVQLGALVLMCSTACHSNACTFYVATCAQVCRSRTLMAGLPATSALEWTGTESGHHLHPQPGSTNALPIYKLPMFWTCARLQLQYPSLYTHILHLERLDSPGTRPPAAARQGIMDSYAISAAAATSAAAAAAPFWRPAPAAAALPATALLAV
jgi:hypothetical protein